MGQVIAAVVGLAFGVTALREVRRWWVDRPVRLAQREQKVLYRTPLLVKLDRSVLPSPNWALGARGFRLIVRTACLQIVGIGPGQSWYLDATHTTMAADEAPTPLASAQHWILINSVTRDRPLNLAIRPTSKTRLREVWDALLSAGVRATSAPPAL